MTLNLSKNKNMLHSTFFQHLVDSVENERDTGHEGWLEDRGVTLPPLLDHRGLVRQGVGSAVPCTGTDSD